MANYSFLKQKMRHNIQKQPKAYNFIKKKVLAQVFSCEFCQISKNTFLTEHFWTT